MKKVILYFVGIIIIIFLIPIVCTSQIKETSADSNFTNNAVTQSIIENNYDYKQYQTVKLLHTADNSIEELKLDEYLYGVVSAEMPANFQEEALKAQAVVARTYTLYKIINNSTKHGEAQICDNSACCQAWISKEDRLAKWEESERENNWNKIVNAVNATQGKIITYNNEPINAFFHSNSGGKTEIPINVWGGSGMPYLQVVETSGEENYSQYSSEVTISIDVKAITGGYEEETGNTTSSNIAKTVDITITVGGTTAFQQSGVDKNRTITAKVSGKGSKEVIVELKNSRGESYKRSTTFNFNNSTTYTFD